MGVLSRPNLPEKMVRGVLVDYRTDHEIIKNIEKLGITVYRNGKACAVHPAIQGHADISICHIGENIFVCEPTLHPYYNQLFGKLNLHLIAGNSRLTSTYPQDAAYNVARIGNFALHNFPSTDSVLKEQLKRFHISTVQVAQGYSKCNLCPVSQNAFITEDESISKRAGESGFDVLKITKGFVRLDGFPYGFFGGAAGLLSPECLAVTGSLSMHPDRERIVAFCAGYGVKIYELSSQIPVDIGSILPIYE